MMQINRFSLRLLLVCLSLIFSGCAQPQPITPTETPAVSATSGIQTTSSESKPTASAVATGGIWIRTNSADASTLNPILSSDTPSYDVEAMLFPSLIGQDPFTGMPVPAGSMSESWDVSQDGLTWTFHLRKGVVWSDGKPVDASDFKFTYGAIASDKVETPRKSNVEKIASIEAPDPLTIIVKFKEVKCDGLNDLGLPWLPSHLYAPDFSNVMTNTLNTEPKLSAGPFIFKSWIRDANLTLVRNTNYWEGEPHMEGMIYKVVPDPGAQLAQLQSGEVDVMNLNPDQVATANSDPKLNIFSFRDDGYDFIGLNLANPAHPQPGKDEKGNSIEQEPHPILGDIRVRQAIAHALDYKSIIANVYLGQGYQIASNVLPVVTWAYDSTITPYETNLDQAKQLLDEAGWKESSSGDVRQKDGKKLSLTLIADAGNTAHEDLGAIVQQQLYKIGFDIKFQTMEFGAEVNQLLGQTYDMAIIGWTGIGADPNDDSLWRTDFDTPDSGFNFTSYHNPKVDELLHKGVSVPGCKPEARAPYYREIQKIIHDDVPYVFITGGVRNIAYNKRWQGLKPGAWNFYHNVRAWSLKP